jgi:hypothetical protein
MERDHRNGGDPVQSLLILTPVHERRLHESVLRLLLSGKKPMHDNKTARNRL